MLPDFVIIGGQKCGTAWLEENLNKTGCVATPKRQVHFFDENYNKGEIWYREKFQHCDSSKIIGEKTTEYFCNNKSSIFSKMHETIPNAKIILILRDPVKRALSAARHSINVGLVRYTNDIGKLIMDDYKKKSKIKLNFIERGFYLSCIKSLHSYYSRDQVLILFFEEDIVRDPEKGFKKVTDFLGASKIDFSKLDLGKKINSHYYSKVGCMLNYFSRLFLNNNASLFIRKIVRYIEKIGNFSEFSFKVDKEVIDHLNKIYNQPNKELFDYLKIDNKFFLK